MISFSGRLPADQAQWLHHVVDVGEYGLALEDLAAMLAHDKIVDSHCSGASRHGSHGPANANGSRADLARPPGGRMTV